MPMTRGLLNITAVAGAALLMAGCSISGDAETQRRALGLGAGLPTSYPLLPGDDRLWAQMTPAQRERALLFLADGSTIASSLKTD